LELVAGFQVGGFGPAVGGVVPKAVVGGCGDLLPAAAVLEGDLDEVVVGGGADDAINPVLLRTVSGWFRVGDTVTDVNFRDRFGAAVCEEDSGVAGESVASLRPKPPSLSRFPRKPRMIDAD
jgi:hypothetical protein